jgi:O-antigen ligase
VPGALAVYLGFNAGGFFVGSTAVAALTLALLLLLRALVARNPFEGFGGPLTLAAAALTLYAVWVLVSAAWSDAPARALLEFDRALLYLLALLLFGSVAGDSSRLRWLLRGLALAFLGICAVGLATRLAPDVWHIDATLANDRLSYPITYWNGMGLAAALGALICLHLTSSQREHPIVRVLAAAALPVLATTLFFTFSRGAMAAGAVALGVYLVLGFSRTMPSGLLAGVPFAAIAVLDANHAALLATGNPTTPEAAAQGHDVALVLVLCVGGAALVRALLLLLDAGVARIELPRVRGAAVAAALVAAVVLAATVALSVDAPDAVARQYHRFVDGDAVGFTGDYRARLSTPGNNGRLKQWDIALDAFQRDRLKGEGAGTYALLWVRERPIIYNVTDAHSLYIETLGELGLPGLILLLVAIGTVLVVLTLRLRGPDRPLYAACLALTLGWALHAGVDWDWELPVVSLWVFALAGIVLARSRAADEQPRPRTSMPIRLAVAAGCVALGVTPALVAYSQLRLNQSVDAFRRGDCQRAIDAGLSSASALPIRPEPYEIVSYCDVRLRANRLGRRAIDRAVERDPHNWEFHYARAIVLGATGSDPRSEARIAHRLNPRNRLTQDAVKRFRRSNRRSWRRLARSAPLNFARPQRLPNI